MLERVDSLVLSDDERAGPNVVPLFAGLENAPSLLLAVSGGPDSLALMLLAARWVALQKSPPAIHVATVDHGLRPASGREAAHVATAAGALGLSHGTLVWLGPKPRARIQERARTARYALLTAHAKAIGATHILTGHHADDQAETVLFRMGRGSGIAGLAGMKRDTALDGLTLMRPLLTCSKAVLVAICRSAGQAFVEDPSNHDPAYARARLRGAVPQAEALGLDAPTLCRLAARMARAEAALESEARRWFASIAPGIAQGVATERFEAQVATLADAPTEILLRVLRLAVETVVGDSRPLRLERLESLTQSFEKALRNGQDFRGTLHGTCITLWRDTMLVIVREAPRRRGRGSQERE